MKKFLFLASGAALALASCSDDLGLKNNQVEDQVIEGVSTITATFPLGSDEADTRTTMQFNGSDYTYYWEAGDAIGVYGEEDVVFDNVPFVYAGTQPSISGRFAGQVALTPDDLYIAYYPYNSPTDGTPVYDDGTISLQIKSTQFFNVEAAKATWSDNYATGCFINYAAPAVAWGYATANNQLPLTFNPVASYLVLPVCGYNVENISQVVLTVEGSSSDSSDEETAAAESGNNLLPLAGTIKVPVGDYITGASLQNLGVASDVSSQITLNITDPLTLDATTPVNLWYVVPADLRLAGSTINLSFLSEGEEIAKASYAIPSDFQGSNAAKQVMGRNQVRWIWPNPATDTPFFAVPTNMDSYVIQSQAQFIEYAYLITHGPEAAQALYDEVPEYNQGYSDLMNMLDVTGSTAKVKNALIVNNINFTQSGIWSYFNVSNLNQLSRLGKYFVEVYGQFLEEGNLAPIGGYWGATIEGANSKVPFIQLNNLKVAGTATKQGLFYGKASAKNTIKNLALNYVNVDYTGVKALQFTFFSSDYNTYSNVVVNSTCGVVPGTSSSSSIAYQTALFGTLNASTINSTTPSIVVTNNVPNLPFAITLNVDANFNFTKNNINATVSSFKNIILDNSKGWGAQLTVANKTAATELMTLVQNDDKVGYSILDNATSPTSYWTGTTYGFGDATTGVVTAATAEQLAFAAQSENSGYIITLTKNIDLMGDATTRTTLGDDFTQYWWNNGAANKKIAVSVAVDKNGKPLYSVNNVYIDGSQVPESSNPVRLSLLGYQSQVTNLVVNNLTIVNTGTKAAVAPYISAISTVPYATSSATVNGMNVTSSTAINNVIGGLYYILNNTSSANIDYLTTAKGAAACSISNFTYTLTPEKGKIAAGWLAGNFEMSMTGGETYTINNPVTGIANNNMFGVSSFTVTPSNDGTNMATNITLNGFGSTSPYLITSNNLYGTSTTPNSNTVNVFYGTSVKQIFQYYKPSTGAKAPWAYYVLQ